jgi:hypothetical protein
VNSNTLHQGQKEKIASEEQLFSVPSILLSKEGGETCGIRIICERYDDKDNRVDPINSSVFRNIMPGTLSIQFKVTDSTGKCTTANVVTVQSSIYQ